MSVSRITFLCIKACPCRQVEQLEKAAAVSAQAARRADAAKLKALADIARKDGMMEVLQTRLDSAERRVISPRRVLGGSGLSQGQEMEGA